jgi:hypothetical protein
MPARSEQIVLDPTEVATPDREELDLHSGAIRVREEGPDFGQQEIDAFMVQRAIGAIPIDSQLPNRVITIPLSLGLSGDFDEARIALQAKVARINEEGGWLRRRLIGGTYGEAGSRLFADLVKATLKLGGGTSQASVGVDPDAELILEALPDFYGDTIEEEAFEGTGGASQTFQIEGNLPGRVDLTVTEKSDQDQLGLGWHFRCRNYDAAETADWAYEAEMLTPLDTAAEAELSGASGKTILHNNLGTEWMPVLSTNLKAGTYLTHRGVYDVWARVYSTSEELPWLRLLWDVGDIVAPSENTQVRIPGQSNFYLVNLGQVNIREIPAVGTHRWQGIVQARGEAGGENVYIDSLEFRCADEGSGIVTGNSGNTAPVSATYLVRDEFNQTAGEATGKSAAVGGVYAAVTNSDTTDFEIDATTHRLKRISASDTGTIGTLGFEGRGIGTSQELTDIAMLTHFDFGEPGEIEIDSLSHGHILSYVDNTHFVLVALTPNIIPGPLIPIVEWRVSVYSPSALLATSDRIAHISERSPKGTLLSIVNGNKLDVYVAGPNEELRKVLTVENALIGVKGKAYLYDANTSVGATAREYDSLAIWTPQNDAAIYANRNASLNWQGIYRQSEDGLADGPVAHPGSDLPRIPISGPEERPVEVGVKPSRGNFGEVPDSGLDQIAVQLSYRPCWSGVPEQL